MQQASGRGVAVVTGGSAGLGRAITRELADRGWDVAVLARGADALAAATDEVRQRGRRSLGVSVDVSDASAVDAAAERVEQELGPVELWVNSAMAGTSGFPEHPQPVPPLFESEVGARAVADVADTPRRRTWVGEATAATILGSRFAGRFLDWYLARNAYDGQVRTGRRASTLPPNLWEPVPGDHGARGVFSAQARTWSPQTWAIGHRRTVRGIAMVTGAAVLAAAWRLLRRIRFT